jgi:hypothetical protein
MVTVDWRIVNMPIADAALSESDMCRTPKVRHRTDSSCGELRETEVRHQNFARSPFGMRRFSAALEPNGQPPAASPGFDGAISHCQEITSSAFGVAFLSAAGPGTLAD